MKTKIILTAVILITFLSSCSSDSRSDSNNNNNPTNTETIVVFENSTFTGDALITYTDGTTTTGNFINGKMRFPTSPLGQKVIASVQPENEAFILIGRKEGTSIRLNYYNGTLSHRVAIGGVVPIGSYAEFKLINSNTTTLATNYELEDDLDFMNLQWIPIGVNFSNPFAGNFNGNNHEIENLFVNSNEFAGLFGCTSNSSLVNINNLIIKSGNIRGASDTGGILGIGGDGSVFISNCQNRANVIGSGRVGGIIGIGSQTSIVDNCINYANILSSPGCSAIGGIAGSVYNISFCQNFGDLNIDNFVDYVAGISALSYIATSCSNHGNIINYGNGGVNFSGGIVAYNGNNINLVSSINGCYNIGNINVTATFSVGGIAGFSDSEEVSACYNTGSITNISPSPFSHTGGIIGNFYHNTGLNYPGKISICYNSGNIASLNGSLNSGTGGIIGFSGVEYFSVERCYNIGEVIGTVQSSGNMNGGIVGKILTTNPNLIIITNCFWKDIPSDGAENPLGRVQISISGVVSDVSGFNNIGTSNFSSQLWPSDSLGWFVDNSNWRSLGSWNNGNPIYPKLYYEN